jgi:uncharacterized protein
MSERERYQAGVPCWVDTAQPDPEAAIGFYGDLFGWEFMGPGPMPGEPPGEYFVARLRGRDVAGVSSQPSHGSPQATTWSTYVSVQSADETAELARSAGGTVLVPPFDALPAGRMAVLRDPAGAVVCVWEPRQRQGAELVNEPRAWAMSLLNTRDPNSSKEFYGATFGWETEPLEIGGTEITLWRLPGYVGGEPRQPVPRDVVGAMAPISGNGHAGDEQSHWSIDFWVDDADATVAKAAGLGATVVAPPFHTTGFRTAVIADPQGAVFSVSKLTGVA